MIVMHPWHTALTSGMMVPTPALTACSACLMQDLELYLTKEEEMDGILTVVARCGRMLQRLHITTSLSKDDMKKAITRVLIRVR